MSDQADWELHASVGERLSKHDPVFRRRLQAFLRNNTLVDVAAVTAKRVAILPKNAHDVTVTQKGRVCWVTEPGARRLSRDGGHVPPVYRVGQTIRVFAGNKPPMEYPFERMALHVNNWERMLLQLDNRLFVGEHDGWRERSLPDDARLIDVFDQGRLLAFESEGRKFFCDEHMQRWPYEGELLGAAQGFGVHEDLFVTHLRNADGGEYIVTAPQNYTTKGIAPPSGLTDGVVDTALDVTYRRVLDMRYGQALVELLDGTTAIAWHLGTSPRIIARSAGILAFVANHDYVCQGDGGINFAWTSQIGAFMRNREEFEALLGWCSHGSTFAYGYMVNGDTHVHIKDSLGNAHVNGPWESVAVDQAVRAGGRAIVPVLVDGRWQVTDGVTRYGPAFDRVTGLHEDNNGRMLRYWGIDGRAVIRVEVEL